MSTSGTPERSLALQAGCQPAYYEHARSYNRDTGVFQPYRQAVVDALPLRPGQVVLDVGCGTGLCCGLLRDKVGPAGTVIGIEESPEMAALAREQIAREGWCNAPYVRDFSGFDRPWRYLERLVEDVQVQEMAFGTGYVMTGHTPA